MGFCVWKIEALARRLGRSLRSRLIKFGVVSARLEAVPCPFVLVDRKSKSPPCRKRRDKGGATSAEFRSRQCCNRKSAHHARDASTPSRQKRAFWRPRFIAPTTNSASQLV